MLLYFCTWQCPMLKSQSYNMRFEHLPLWTWCGMICSYSKVALYYIGNWLIFQIGLAVAIVYVLYVSSIMCICCRYRCAGGGWGCEGWGTSCPSPTVGGGGIEPWAEHAGANTHSNWCTAKVGINRAVAIKQFCCLCSCEQDFGEQWLLTYMYVWLGEYVHLRSKLRAACIVLVVLMNNVFAEVCQ